MRGKIKKSVQISVDTSFYDKIERDRREFMRKNKLDKLSTTAFTRIMANRKAIIGGKNAKKKR